MKYEWFVIVLKINFIAILWSILKSYKDLTPDNILVLDCVDGKVQTLGQSRASGGHERRLFAQGGNYFARGASDNFLSKEVYTTKNA